jgi:hypothetical protein
MAALPPAPGHELFIYYRAEPGRAAALAAAVRAMQSELCRAHPGLRARLLCRAELREGLQTWMETYRLPPGADAVAVAAEIERAAGALQSQLSGARHAEHFIAAAG